MPQRGETLKGDMFEQGFGGKGANQCVACAKLGGDVVMITKLGEDSFGRDTKENYEKQGVDMRGIFTTSEGPTGVAPIFVEKSSGENSIVIVGGANDLLTEEEVEKCRSLISETGFLSAQLEIPFSITLKALKIAKEEGVTTVVTPAPAVDDLPDEFFQLTDILCPNQPETELLSGISPIDTIEDAKRAAKELLKKGPKHIILTLGSRGALLVNEEEEVLIPSSKVENVVDTTGAGDCFLGSLLYFLSTGNSVHESCKKACIVAGYSVQKKGTQKSYPTREELPEELFRNTC